jgi:antitoxin component YwqK of YwqJK toxin-antitoxin module
MVMQNFSVSLCRCVLYGVLFYVCVGCKARKKDDGATALKTSYIHRYGVEVATQEDWMARGGTGEIVKIQKNGVTFRAHYSNGILNGPSSWTFPGRDSIEKNCRYHNGVLVEEVCNYVSGTPRQKIVYKKDNNIDVTSWYEDGIPRAEEELCGTKLLSGRYFSQSNEVESEVRASHGTRTVRNGLGELQSRDTIADGEVVLQENYHPSGTPASRTPYMKGKIHGVRITFFPGGEPQAIEEWEAGQLHGKTQIFENGVRIAEIPYQHGKKHGIEYRFQNGSDTVIEEITWAADQRHGPSVSIAGTLQATDWYYGGQKVSKSAYLERGSVSQFSRD